MKVLLAKQRVKLLRHKDEIIDSAVVAGAALGTLVQVGSIVWGLALMIF